MTRTSSGNPQFSAPSRKSWSIEVRKAASVLPEPVGAAMSVCSPRRMARQPSAWASVGSPKRPAHHSRRTGWKSWGSKPTFSHLWARISRGVHEPELAFLLARVHGRVGRLHERGRFRLVVRRERVADRRPDVQDFARDAEGFAESVEQLFPELGRLARAREPFGHDDELVAAQARDAVARANGPAQSPGD